MIRAAAALAWADLLERVRRSSFLVVLALVVWLASGIFTGDVLVMIGSGQGRMNAAWAGAMTTLVANTVLTLFGFWFVRNAVERDERTGVGEILATTPLRRTTYTLGKAASHFAVLVAMLAVLCVAGVVLLLVRGSDGAGFDAVAYFGPYGLVALPALALTAAFAMVFETTPGLRGAFGSVVWMIVWSVTFIVAIGTKNPWLDPWGSTLLTTSLSDAARAHVPGYVEGLTITIGTDRRPDPTQAFPWNGLAWTPVLVATRVAWLGVAALVAALAALPFHRFDPARGRPRALVPAGAAGAAGVAGAGAARGGLARLSGLRRAATALVARLPAGRVGSELRLLVVGGRASWGLVMLGIVVAGFVVPAALTKSVILPLAWIWTLTRFAELGARERRYATTGFLFPSPGYVPWQTLAAWAAGVAFALLAVCGVAVRAALALDGGMLVAIVCGALFVPALALALGTISGTPRLFESVYTLLWYVGPIRHTAALDYAGVTPGSTPAVWAALALVGVSIAIAVRARQLRT
jgi:ABC-type transport system involved in multi-copper enzyme maturation permease subunit